jgi:hypothetical protein
MTRQLQVRQGHVLDRTPQDEPSEHHLMVRWSVWVDVTSPGWLIGFLIQSPQFVYEFREEERGE